MLKFITLNENKNNKVFLEKKKYPYKFFLNQFLPTKICIYKTCLKEMHMISKLHRDFI